jgi:hypothetical protein
VSWFSLALVYKIDKNKIQPELAKVEEETAAELVPVEF